MPIVAFTFGSFGDIVAILQLASQLRGQLHDASGTSAQIRELITDIDVFMRAMHQIRGIVDRRGRELQPDVVNGIEHALSCCKTDLEAVARKTMAFQRKVTRSTGAAGAALWRELWAVTAWSILGGSAEVDALRTRLRDHVNLMQLYLSLTQSHGQTEIRDVLRQQHVALDRLASVVEAVQPPFGMRTPSFHFRDTETGEFYLPCAHTSPQRLEDLFTTLASFRISSRVGRSSEDPVWDTGRLEGREHSFQETVYIEAANLRITCFFFLDCGHWHVLVGARCTGRWTSEPAAPEIQHVLKLLLERRHTIGAQCTCDGMHCDLRFQDRRFTKDQYHMWIICYARATNWMKRMKRLPKSSPCVGPMGCRCIFRELRDPGFMDGPTSDLCKYFLRLEKEYADRLVRYLDSLCITDKMFLAAQPARFNSRGSQSATRYDHRSDQKLKYSELRITYNDGMMTVVRVRHTADLFKMLI